MYRIAVTGSAGQIAYSLLFRLAAGELFGDEPIALHLLEREEMLDPLKGVKMELEDCNSPILKEIRIGSDPHKIFEGVDFVFFIGAKPRSKGMERKELISCNGPIFKSQGAALNKVAKRDVTSLVVGNPCNTNCLVLLKNAPDLSNFHAMTRLDQNRAHFQLAAKSGKEVNDVTIWGNHSSTQVPDFLNAKIDGASVLEVIDRKWLEGDFLKCVQQRGANVIEARGHSSAASAANAALDAARAILFGESHFSDAIYSAGNPYGIDEDLVFSFPCGPNGIIPGLEWDDFLEKKIRESEKELQEEREAVLDLL